MENPIKMDDLGVPPFSETPISNKMFTYIFWLKNATMKFLWAVGKHHLTLVACSSAIQTCSNHHVFVLSGFFTRAVGSNHLKNIQNKFHICTKLYKYHDTL